MINLTSRTRMHLLIVLELTLPDLTGEHPERSVVEFALVVVEHA